MNNQLVLVHRKFRIKKCGGAKWLSGQSITARRAVLHLTFQQCDAEIKLLLSYSWIAPELRALFEEMPSHFKRPVTDAEKGPL